MYGYSYNIEIDGKTMIVEADIDHIVFINCDRIKWSDGTLVTAEDKVKCIKACVEQKIEVAFSDSTGSGYGEFIRYDDDKTPYVKIEGENVVSTYVKCVCEENYPARAIVFQNDFKKYSQVGESGIFEEIPQKNKLFKSKRKVYRCKTCGHIWVYGPETAYLVSGDMWYDRTALEKSNPEKFKKLSKIDI